VPVAEGAVAVSGERPGATVGEATGEDAAAVGRLALAAGFPRWSDGSASALGARPHHRLLVARDGVGGLEGFALGSSVAGEGEVILVAVAPAARRRGVGARLLAALEAWARGEGADSMFLEVAVGNGAARALYDRAGYRQVGVRRGYYRDGAEDALCLSKSLASELWRLPPGP
jgi:ribosomal-protein-alanine N-acetyltransferase